ncbi:MAG: acyl-CoA carboxylase subunit beta [Chloroflexi bacterium]|nr:acyl-CoA carboxylase subunit beta [Chloroflexota bacterium]
MATTREIIEEFQRKREKLLAMAGPETIKKRHEGGQWTARERLDYLFDPGTFTEVGLFVKQRATAFGMDKREIPADGIITGFGKVNGRDVVAMAEDYMAMAGTSGEYHGKKLSYILDFAKEKGWPFVSMNDSGGMRLHEGADAMDAYGRVFRSQIQGSGIVPQIALVMGPVLGGQAYHLIMQDFLIQCRKTGFMGIAGPAFVRTQLGEQISLEDLSGWKAHAIKSGQTHLIAEDDKDAIDKCKTLLSFFPDNNRQKAPRVPTGDDPFRLVPELDGVIPDKPTQPYDMYRIIRAVVDDGYFLETMALHARNAITGFARFNGRPVGIWANQPAYAAGILDVDSSDKGARFVRFCDLFNIPVISFVDCPGYMPGSDQDWRGILRHGSKLLFAWTEATVPLISVIIRRSLGGALYGMLDKSIGSDFTFAWPTFRPAAPETTASVIFVREIRESANPEETKARKTQEYADYYDNPYRFAERGYIDDIILPSTTRAVLNRALDSLENKWEIAPKARPWKKFANINL